jgi:hypothetical protein
MFDQDKVTDSFLKHSIQKPFIHKHTCLSYKTNCYFTWQPYTFNKNSVHLFSCYHEQKYSSFYDLMTKMTSEMNYSN